MNEKQDKNLDLKDEDVIETNSENIVEKEDADVESNEDNKSAETLEKDSAEVAKKNKKSKNRGKSSKPKNKNFLRRSTYVVITSVILAAILILVNVISTVIAQRLPTTIDTSADNSNTLTKENIDFIKKINNNVEIIVCATREGYTGSEMVNYAYNNYYVQENNTPYNYFNQTVTLIENYPKYNSKIKISFVDTQSPNFNVLESDTKTNISYGDIVVRCTREVDGSQKTNTTVVTFDDIYELTDSSGGYASMGMGYYSITSSNIESSLSSAIYTVAASEKRTIAVIKDKSGKDSYTSLTDQLKGYNYNITEIEGLVTSEKLKDVDTVLMVSPVSDLTGDELKALDSFLYNDGKRNKSFFTFGSISAPATPNLNQFMEEWGIGVKDGIAYETNDNNKASTPDSPNAIYLSEKEDDLTKSIKNANNLYLAQNNIALNRLFETKDKRTTHVLMTTSANAVIAPKGTASGYTPPSDENTEEIPVIMVTADTTYDSNYNDVSSYVGYFASSDFISSSWLNYKQAGVGNMEYTITVINSTCGRDNSLMYFLPKITGTTAMTVTDAQKTAVRIVTLYVLPIVVLLGGVLIWIRRRNR